MSLPGTGRIRSKLVSGSVPRKEMDLYESARVKLFAYRWVPDHERSKGWGQAKTKCQPEDPGPIPWDVVQADHFRLDPRRERYGRRLPGDYFRHVWKYVGFFWNRYQGLFNKPLLRQTFRDKASYIPFDFWSRGLGISKVEAPIRRSGVDSVGRGKIGSASPWPSTTLISLLASLRFRRWLFGRRRSFENFISLLCRRGWWFGGIAGLVTLIPF